MNFAKFLRTPFLIEHLRWLLLRLQFLKIVYGQSEPTTLGNPFKLLRNFLKEQMLRVLHVVYLEKSNGHSIFRDCSFNQFRAEKLAE